MVNRGKLLRVVQWLLIGTGVVLIGIWAGFRIHASAGRDADLQRFSAAREAIRSATPRPSPMPAKGLPTELPVDTSLWDEGRIEEYRESLEHELGAPLAILRIPTIDLEVAVLPGTGELVLNRGVGHIEGTAAPGAAGNVGIAGHRDGYFRGLKDVVTGDTIELETLDRTLSYEITELFIVDPPDVWVLEPTDDPTLTLVTCYPFYFAGSAPQRYIVRAELAGSPE